MDGSETLGIVGLHFNHLGGVNAGMRGPRFLKIRFYQSIDNGIDRHFYDTHLG
jgi:hypothetical protein